MSCRDNARLLDSCEWYYHAVVHVCAVLLVDGDYGACGGLIRPRKGIAILTDVDSMCGYGRGTLKGRFAASKRHPVQFVLYGDKLRRHHHHHQNFTFEQGIPLRLGHDVDNPTGAASLHSDGRDEVLWVCVLFAQRDFAREANRKKDREQAMGDMMRSCRGTPACNLSILLFVCGHVRTTFSNAPRVE